MELSETLFIHVHFCSEILSIEWVGMCKHAYLFLNMILIIVK